MKQPVAKVLETLYCIWLKWPIDDLLLLIPPPPFIKVSSITKSCSELWGKNFEWTGGGRSVLYLTDL